MRTPATRGHPCGARRPGEEWAFASPTALDLGKGSLVSSLAVVGLCAGRISADLAERSQSIEGCLALAIGSLVLASAAAGRAPSRDGAGEAARGSSGASSAAFLAFLYPRIASSLGMTAGGPYRTRARPNLRGARAGGEWDRELLVVFGLLWAVSLIRVVGALMRGEAFGAEATLALLAVLGVPWVWSRQGRCDAEVPARGARP